MANIGRNELIQSAKSKFYFATKFQKQKDVQSIQAVTKATISSAFVLTPTVSLTSFAWTDSRIEKAAGRVDKITPWPNVKECYELQEIIGVWTTAEVYAAFCIPRKEKCAIKQVDLKKWASGLENLLKDVQAMTVMNHENLVTIYTAFADRDELWLVLQYMGHRSLLSLIKRKLCSTNCTQGVFDEQTIATIMTGVLSGLEFIHSNGYIHRDIKAENILLGANGQVQIADFTTTNCTARFNSFVGSPCWLAPEIIEDPEHTYTSKADIWSMGITAIEMATGYPPYHKRPTMKVLMWILLHESPCMETDAEVRDQYKKYGKALRNLIHDCLQKTPSKRPSATELLFHSFLKKTQDRSYLQQVFAGVPPDTETRFRKPFMKVETPYLPPRRELIWNPDDLAAQDQASYPEDRRRTTTVTYNSEKTPEAASDKTSVSLKTRSSGRKQSRILNMTRAVAYVYHIVLRIRGLHLDTPMILKTAIRKERELFDIKFAYFVDRDTPEGLTSDLVREGLIDPKDRIPVTTNLRNLVKTATLGGVTFPLVSEMTSTESLSESRLIGYASLSLVSIQPTSGSSTQSLSSMFSSNVTIKTPSLYLKRFSTIDDFD